MNAEMVHANPWMMLPFGILLGLLAVGPVMFSDWWHRHYAKPVLLLAFVTLVYYFLGLHAFQKVAHAAHEYFSFIALIGSLYVVAGGIHINVKGEATPFANVVFLLVGALLANLLGTTGASMLLIRPWLRMNKYRVTAHHIIFFIFIVANVGGCLTPIGDPPLFLGYIMGVPFWWVAQHCWPMWVVGMGVLLTMFYLLDRVNYLRAPKEVRERLTSAHEEWRFEGLGNIVFLAVILAAVFITKTALLREGLMIGAAVASYFITRKEVHDANHFTFHPIEEVAVVFIGIFATMLPALDWLTANAGQFREISAAGLFWGSGTLSSALDNAPTYIVFLKAISLEHASLDSLLSTAAGNQALLAISIGTVFFGANTYIGNGPNFMIKSIATHQKIHMPGFFKYLWSYTLPFMLPMLLLVWWLFFRHNAL